MRGVPFLFLFFFILPASFSCKVLQIAGKWYNKKKKKFVLNKKRRKKELEYCK